MVLPLVLALKVVRSTGRFPPRGAGPLPFVSAPKVVRIAERCKIVGRSFVLALPVVWYGLLEGVKFVGSIGVGSS